MERAIFFGGFIRARSLRSLATNRSERSPREKAFVRGFIPQLRDSFLKRMLITFDRGSIVFASFVFFLRNISSVRRNGAQRYFGEIGLPQIKFYSRTFVHLLCILLSDPVSHRFFSRRSTVTFPQVTRKRQMCNAHFQRGTEQKRKREKGRMGESAAHSSVCSRSRD